MEIIPDIKEKQPLKTVAKEHRTTAPKELVRRGSAEMAVKAKQQIMEASRGGQTEEQDNQQTTLEMPILPRPHGTKIVKESKDEPKTRENYIENLQNRHEDIPEVFRNKHTAETIDIKPIIEIETEPVTIPRQGSQALAESQGRNAARKKMVQKRAARNKPTPTDPESVGVSLSHKEAKIEEIRPDDGKSAYRTVTVQIKP